MASISSAGTGLDVRGLVDKLVTAEGAPVRSRLDRKEAKLQAGMSAIGTLKSSLSEFQSSLAGFKKMESLQSKIATSDDEGVLTVSASNLAQEGEYDIEVEELAQTQRLISVGFESDFMPLGSGSLRIQYGRYDEDDNKFLANPEHELHVIRIEDNRSSLRDIQKSINDAKIGLKASVIHDDDVYRLVLTSAHEGADNGIRLGVQDDDDDDLDLISLSMLSFDPISRDGKGRNMVETRGARDAELEIDGLTVYSSSNTVTDIIDGLTLTLKETGSADVEIILNQPKITEKVKAFVNGHNKLIDAVEQLAGFNPDTRIAGPLNGDATVRAVVNQIRRIVGSSFAHANNKYQSLAGIGITTQSTGKLSLNQSKLQHAIDDNLEEVMNLFSKTGRTTDPQISFLKANDRTESGSYNIHVSQRATKGGYAAVRMDRNNFPLYISESNDEFVLRVDGIKTANIKLDHGNYFSGHEVADAIQEKVNQDANIVQKGVKIWASFYDRRLIIVSEKLGAGSSVEMVSGDNELMEDLGFSLGSGLVGQDVKGTIAGFQTQGTGRVLTGRQGLGLLQVEILNGESGSRGKIVYSKGVAVQLDELIAGFLESQGVMKVRIDGYSSRLDDIEQQRQRLAHKLEKTEERYLKQFTKLEGLLGKMNSTSQFLTGQLKGLPGARRS